MDKAASIFLRADINTSDTEYLIKWLSNKNATRYLSDDERSAAEVRKLVTEIPPYLWQMQLNQHGLFYMVDLGNTPIGFIKLLETGDGECEIVVALGSEKVWGKGYGTAAVRKCLQLAFFEHRIKTINAKIKSENIRSLKLFEKVKFERTGVSSDMYHYTMTFRRFVS